MTLRLLTGGTFSNAALPVFTPQLNGFTQRSLVNLQRLADAAPLTAARDDVSGTSVGVATSGTVTTTVLSGGGLRLKGNAWLSTAVAVDITQPWTFAAGLQVLTTAAGNVGIISTPDYPVRGNIVYSQPGVIGANTPVVGTFRESIDGAQSGSSFGLPSNAGWYYGRGAVLFVRHIGSGSGALDIWAAGALVFSQTLTLNLVGEQGPIGSKTALVKFCAGTSNPTFAGQDINVEGQALWSKSLTLAEQSVNFSAFAALASARGRAWA